MIVFYQFVLNNIDSWSIRIVRVVPLLRVHTGPRRPNEAPTDSGSSGGLFRLTQAFKPGGGCKAVVQCWDTTSMGM